MGLSARFKLPTDYSHFENDFYKVDKMFPLFVFKKTMA